MLPQGAQNSQKKQKTQKGDFECFGRECRICRKRNRGILNASAGSANSQK